MRSNRTSDYCPWLVFPRLERAPEPAARLDMPLRRSLALIAALFSLAAFAGQAQASKTQESIVQDDRMLLHYGSGAQAGALNALVSRGFTTVHGDIPWKSLAPSPDSAKPPKG